MVVCLFFGPFLYFWLIQYLKDFIVLRALIPEWLVICCCNCLCCKDLNFSTFLSRLLLIMCTSFVSYHLSWVAVGIMVNPAWGVSILLVLSSFFRYLIFCNQ